MPIMFWCFISIHFMLVGSIIESDLGELSTSPHGESNTMKWIFSICTRGLSNQNCNISYVSAIKPKLSTIQLMTLLSIYLLKVKAKQNKTKTSATAQ